MPTIQPAKKIGEEYQNPIPTSQSVKGGMLKIMWQFLTTKNGREPKNQLGPFLTDPAIYNTLPASGLRITLIGHSSLLIEIDGKRILTDPVWGPRASFLSFVGPKRFFAPPLPLDKLPALDAIILSHDHYDHLDYPTIKKLALGHVPVYCSVGVGAIIEKWGVSKSRITEMNWGDTINPAGLSITATPARHFSGRSITNRNQTLWSSWVIKGEKHNIFFGADSGWFPGFKEIGDTYGPFDLTMLEIGAYGEGWPDIHMGPDNATNAHLALKGKIMMPIHWGTFNLALHPWKEPVERFVALAAQKQINAFIPTPGMPTEVTGAFNSQWWM
jgi:L-ascorbate metabolism protein UlaG (beta-lactamase superfamily)